MLATRPPALNPGELVTSDDDASTALTTADLPDSRRLTPEDADEILGRAAAMTAHRKAMHRGDSSPRSVTTMTIPEAKRHMAGVAEIAGVVVDDQDLETALAEYKPSLLDRIAQLETLQAQPDKTVVTGWVVEAIFESLNYYLAERGLSDQKGNLNHYNSTVPVATHSDGGYWRYDDYHSFSVITENKIYHPGFRFLFWKTKAWTEVITKEIASQIITVESRHIDEGIVVRLHDLRYASVLEKIKPALDLLRQYQNIEIVIGGQVVSPSQTFRYAVSL